MTFNENYNFDLWPPEFTAIAIDQVLTFKLGKIINLTKLFTYLMKFSGTINLV